MLIDVHTHQVSPSHLCVQNFDLGNIGQIGNSPNLTQSYYSVGFHPWNFNSQSKYDTQQILQQLFEKLKAPNCVFLGEIGLDRIYQDSYMQQVRFLEEFFKWVKGNENELQKPIVFHCVRAYQDIIELLKKYPVSVPIIFHDYNGNAQITQSLLQFQTYFSIGTGVFRDNSKLIQDIDKIPLERVLFETDDQQKFAIHEIYQKFCELRKLDFDETEKLIEENFLLCLGRQILPTPCGTIA